MIKHMASFIIYHHNVTVMIKNVGAFTENCFHKNNISEFFLIEIEDEHFCFKNCGDLSKASKF